MIKIYCNDCAKTNGKQFDLQAQLKKNVKNAACECCGKRPNEGCMIYEVQRREEQA